VQIGGKASWAVPILFASTEKYDMSRGGEFFDYLQFQFLIVERSADSSVVRTVYDGQHPRLVGIQQVSGFIEQIGRNTRYIIHPEEILADNFALLILEEPNVPSPEVISKLRAALMER
jgi:hypothetical protein